MRQRRRRGRRGEGGCVYCLGKGEEGNTTAKVNHGMKKKKLTRAKHGGRHRGEEEETDSPRLDPSLLFFC